MTNETLRIMLEQEGLIEPDDIPETWEEYVRVEAKKKKEMNDKIRRSLEAEGII